MTRDEARAAFADADLDYSVLSDRNLKRLRDLINDEMRSSGCINGSLRAKQRFSKRRGPNGDWAHLKCNAYYFDDRQAITFEPHGFIGFAGWADETNVQPILSAFVAWVDEMRAAQSRFEERSDTDLSTRSDGGMTPK